MIKGEGIFPTEIRKRRASCAARAGDGKRRTRAYLSGDSGSAAGGGEIDVHIDMNDVRVDVFRASGNGGQCQYNGFCGADDAYPDRGLWFPARMRNRKLKEQRQALKVLYARV